ncbi:MAG: DUF350 domain-containing protein [Kordiimonadaceae bacterium]|nr:DUF350 domain-containing protein [Kordiimonadaceae bacterium]
MRPRAAALRRTPLAAAPTHQSNAAPHDLAHHASPTPSTNVAAASSFGGAIVGLALPLAFSLAAAVSLWDLAIWGAVALVLQLVAFRLADLFLKGISARIEAGEISAAIMLVSVKLATAFINSAAISG